MSFTRDSLARIALASATGCILLEHGYPFLGRPEREWKEALSLWMPRSDWGWENVAWWGLLIAMLIGPWSMPLIARSRWLLRILRAVFGMLSLVVLMPPMGAEMIIAALVMHTLGVFLIKNSPRPDRA